MGTAAVEKTEEELRREIGELHRQQREVHSLSIALRAFVFVRFASFLCLMLFLYGTLRLRSDFEILEGSAEVGFQVLVLATSLPMEFANEALFDLSVIFLPLFFFLCFPLFPLWRVLWFWFWFSAWSMVLRLHRNPCFAMLFQLFWCEWFVLVLKLERLSMLEFFFKKKSDFRAFIYHSGRQEWIRRSTCRQTSTIISCSQGKAIPFGECL